jgi:predicted permease
MLETISSILGVYFFIFLGYIAKATFKEKIDEKTLILISVYFLQPILVFWGLTSTPINSDIIKTPFIYIIIILITLFINIIVARFLFKDSKDSSIFIVSSLIGNTGNLGIPLGIAIFGESSLIYTSMINIMNIFFIYTIGIYFYARSSFTIKEALKSMIKIPIIWTAIVAIIFNIQDIEIPLVIEKSLQMGGYTAIVIQLIIFGTYMYSVKIKNINKKLIVSTISIKTIILPIVAILVLFSLDYNNFIKAIIFMEIAVPLAVNNVNIAALYECKPIDVASIVFFSSILFLLLINIYLYIIDSIFIF